MFHIVAKDAKNRFGQLLTSAMKGPVTIDKNNKPVAVLISTDEYKRLEKVEEDFLALKAQSALKEGFIGIEESEIFLKELLNA
ncbi:MAG: type II toxin-antitoxin system Phd/YefM family antitoxin [Proteobacteria bacterium]|nr:type II toxin-antitoxin system Phd/YefM family antitoxin [Pseudomonadota bacterium]